MCAPATQRQTFCATRKTKKYVCYKLEPKPTISSVTRFIFISDTFCIGVVRIPSTIRILNSVVDKYRSICTMTGLIVHVHRKGAIHHLVKSVHAEKYKPGCMSELIAYSKLS